MSKTISLYTIYDKVAEESGNLFEAKNNGIAIRRTVQLMSSVGVNTISDYKLLYVGLYEPEKALITPIDPPQEIDFAPLYLAEKQRMEDLNNVK